MRRMGAICVLAIIAGVLQWGVVSMAEGERIGAGAPAGEGNGKADRLTIEIGTLGADEAGDFLLAEVNSFREAHPEMKVLCYAIQEPRRHVDPLHTLDRLARNVIGISSEAGTEVYHLVLRDLIVPIDRFLPDPDFSTDLFYPNLWDAVTYKDKRWGVPYLCDSYAMLCDMSLLEAEGISEPPTTWDDLWACAKKLTKDTNGDGRIDQWGLNLGSDHRNEGHLSILWKTMVLQKGGYFVKEGRFDLSHPSLREAYEFIERLRSSGTAREDYRFLTDILNDRDLSYAIQFHPAYRLKNTGGQTHLRFAYMPTFGKQVVVDDKRYYLAIRKSTPEKEAASWEFVKWVCRREASKKRSSPSRFTFPCRKDLLESEEVRRSLEPYAQNAELVHYAKAWPVQWHNIEADTPEAKERFNEIVGELFSHHLSFEEAMSKAETECNAILRSEMPAAQPYALYTMP